MATRGPTNAKRANSIERRKEAWDLRLMGLNLSQIATKMGVSISAVSKLLRKALAERESDYAETRKMARELMLERIESARQAIAKQVAAGDLFAIDREVKLLEQFAKVHGVYAPTRVEGSMSVDFGNAKKSLEARLNELSRRFQEEDTPEGSQPGGEGLQEQGGIGEVPPVPS